MSRRLEIVCDGCRKAKCIAGDDEKAAQEGWRVVQLPPMGVEVDLCPKCAPASYAQLGPRRVPLAPSAVVPKTRRQERMGS